MSGLNINTVKILSNEEARITYFSSKQSMLCHNKDFVKMTGSIKGAIFLTQIMYWDNVMWRKNHSGRFYKADWDWKHELSMSRATLKRLRGKLKTLGYISVYRRGDNGINHYTVHWDKVMLDLCIIRDGSSCNNQPKIPEMSQPERSICAIRKGQNEPSHIIHKNTSNNTHHHPPENPKPDDKPHLVKNVLKNDEECVKNYKEMFEILWASSPKKICKEESLKSFMTVMNNRLVDFETLLQGIKDYAVAMRDQNKELRYVKSLTKWLDDQRWTDVYCSKPSEKISTLDNDDLRNQIIANLNEFVGKEREICLSILQTVTPSAYQAWFRDISIAIMEDRIDICFPTRFRKDYAEVNFKNKIEPLISRIEGLDNKWICFKLSESEEDKINLFALEAASS